MQLSDISNPLHLVREQMSLRGGDFVQRLAILMRYADPENMAKILAAFPEIISRYDAIASMENAKGGHYCAILDITTGQYKIHTPCGIVRNIGNVDAAISMAAMLKSADQMHARVSDDARAKILKAHFLS